MKKPKFCILHCHVYPYDILATVGATIDEIKREADRIFGKVEFDDASEGVMDIENRQGKFIHCGKPRVTILWLKRLVPEPASIATATHEIFHATAWVMERVGVVYDEKSDEAFAYLMEHLMKQLLQGMRYGKN